LQSEESHGNELGKILPRRISVWPTQNQSKITADSGSLIPERRSLSYLKTLGPYIQ
jgi:hypothetical protein